MDAHNKYSSKEVASWFSDHESARRYPPILTLEQVMDLLQVTKGTVYSWSSRGLLDECKIKTGKHLRFSRDRLLVLVCNGGLSHDN